MDWIILGPVVIILIVCIFILRYNAKKISKYADEVLERAIRVNRMADEVEHELVEAKQATARLVYMLNNIERDVSNLDGKNK